MEQYAVSPLPESSGIDLLETPENENTKNIQDKNDGESNGSILNEILQSSRPVSEFELLDQIGEGAYGVVSCARDTKTNQIVALKRIRSGRKNEGIPARSLREIEILKACEHENIIKLNEVLIGEKWGRLNVYLSLECCDQDLANLVDNKHVTLTEAQVKCISLQVLAGLQYLHSKHIVHRDLKVSNLLLTNEGYIKIGDFGLARYLIESSQPMTPQVVTLWYRPPEILLGSSKHSSAIDMWAFGCVVAELLEQKPLFPATTEIAQLGLIVDLIGAPTFEIWPELEQLPCSSNFAFTPQPENRLKDRFTRLSAHGLALLNGLLMYNSDVRLTASQCIQNVYFGEEPLPCDKKELIQTNTLDDSASSDNSTTLRNQTPQLPPGVTSEDVTEFLNSLTKKRRIE